MRSSLLLLLWTGLCPARALSAESRDGGLLYQLPLGWVDRTRESDASDLRWTRGAASFTVNKLRRPLYGRALRKAMKADRQRLARSGRRVSEPASFEVSDGGEGLYAGYPRGGSHVYFGYIYTGSRSYSFLLKEAFREDLQEALKALQPKAEEAVGGTEAYRGAPKQAFPLGDLMLSLPAPEGFEFRSFPGGVDGLGPHFSFRISKEPIARLALRYRREALSRAFLNGEGQRKFDPRECTSGREQPLSRGAGVWRFKAFRCPKIRKSFGLAVFATGRTPELAFLGTARTRAEAAAMKAYLLEIDRKLGDAAGVGGGGSLLTTENAAEGAAVSDSTLSARADSLMLPDSEGGGWGGALLGWVGVAVLLLATMGAVYSLWKGSK